MYCPKCGSVIPDESLYCSYCNSRIVTYAQEPTFEGTTEVMNNSDGGTAPMPAVSAAQTVPTAPLPPASASYPQAPQYAPAAYQATGTYPGAASYQEAVPMAPMAPVAPQKKSKLPLVLFLVALAALAAAAAVMFGMRGCSLAGPTSSPESAVQSAADAALDLDFNRMLDSVAPDVVDYGIAAAGYSSRDDLVAFLDNSVAQLDETVGIFGIDARSLMKFINVKTTDVSYYSEEGLTGLRSEWNGRVPGFGDKIQDAATVTVEFSGQFDLFGKSVSLSDYIGSTTQYVTTAKVDGQWYVLEADLRDLKALLP